MHFQAGHFALLAFSSLFSVINPISAAPLFVALTPGASAGERRRVAFRACLAALGILALFAAAGADPAIVPLGIPLIAGPGAISTMMVLVGQSEDAVHRMALGGALAANIALTFLILLAAPAIVERIGATGQRIVAKVMGLITAVIGVQFIINGVTTVLRDILRNRGAA